ACTSPTARDSASRSRSRRGVGPRKSRLSGKSRSLSRFSSRRSVMKFVLFLASVLFTGTVLAQAPAATGLDGVHDMKVAFDVIDGNPKVLVAKLANIDTTRKQLIDAGVTPHMV